MRKLSSHCVFALILLASACGGEEPATLQEAQSAALETGAFRAELNGFEIHYEVRGQGPVCMVLPLSWGLSHEGMRGFLNGLEEHFTMIYFDPRGVGRSGPLVVDEDMSMAAVRKDCHALLAHLGIERVILLGWSNSGMNALAYTAEHPEQVDKLILLHTFHYIPPEQAANVMKKFAENFKSLGAIYQMEGGEEEKESAWRKFFVEEWVPLAICDYEAHRERIAHVIDNADMSLRHNIYKHTFDNGTVDGREACAQITAPTLIISGVYDIFPYELGEMMHEAIAGSKYVLLESSGHFGFIEEPELFMNAVLDFIGSH